ncbi:hypothetical protein GGX14DRAFT_575362 [Mycena pura]|uniref:Uncharacterized protein n=1 Tax=Mycena pura TaxID=153505 RepID=A0AAD6Y2C3_9AGAR|nr:hypothetical protein GGX14DRAFT_575362 [Mycena pura]
MPVGMALAQTGMMLFWIGNRQCSRGVHRGPGQVVAHVQERLSPRRLKKPARIRVDFAKLVPSKVKSGSKAVNKGLKALARGQAGPVTAKPKPRFVAESASEDEEAVSSDEHASDAKNDGSEEENIEDESPSEDEFQAEVMEGNNASESADMSIGLDKPRKWKGKGRPREAPEPETDDTLSDAPRRAMIPDSQPFFGRVVVLSQDLRVPDSDAEDIDNFEASIALPRKKASRRASTASRASCASGRQPVGESDAENSMEEVEAVPMKLVGKRSLDAEDRRLHEAITKELTTILKVSVARQKQADKEKPEVRPAAVAGPSKGLTTQLDRIAAAAMDAASRPEFEWHVSARIMFPAPGKDIGLTSQTEECSARGSAPQVHNEW